MKKVDKKAWFLTGSLIYFLIIASMIMFANFAKVVDTAGKEVAFMDGLYLYKWNTIYEKFLIMGESGRQSYTVFHILDYFFLTSYALLMISLTLIFVPSNKKWIAVAFPLIPAVFDIIENTILEVLSSLYPLEYPVWAKLAAIITPIKWGSGVLWFVIFLATVVFFFINKSKTKQLMVKE